jgi:apolipoprotein N-acyltransferase
MGEHRLHARVAPLRSAEYRVPIFRVASSGISQLTARSGHVVASAGVPGQGTPIDGNLNAGRLLGSGHWIAGLGRLATGVVALAALWLCASAIVATRRNLGNPPPGQPLA